MWERSSGGGGGTGKEVGGEVKNMYNECYLILPLERTLPGISVSFCNNLPGRHFTNEEKLEKYSFWGLGLASLKCSYKP